MLICLGENYIVIYDKKLTRSKFIEACRVRKDTWAEDFAKRLYECLMGNTKDVCEEYKRFYQVEYATLTEFIAKVYGLSGNLARKINKHLKHDEILAYGSFDSEGDYNMGQLIQFSDDIVDAVNQVFEKARGNENKKQFRNE